MAAIARTDRVDPKTLDAAARAELVEALYAVHCEVFEGVERDAFAKYVVDSKAERTCLHVHRAADGAIVGYFALHAFERTLDGRPCVVLRAEAGSLRAWRGGNANLGIGLRFLFSELARAPTARFFYLGSLVHPSSYAAFARWFPTLWPRPGDQPSPETLAFMDALATSFGLERVAPGNPLVRKVGWRTRDSDVERAYWRACEKPAARFFVDANPGYGDGDGLVTLLELRGRTVLGVLGRLVADRVGRVRARLSAAVERLPVVGPVRRARVVDERLRAAPLLAHLDAAARANVARVARVATFPAGHELFRVEDPSDFLAVVLHGSVYVVGPDGHLIDQLGAGAIVGEVGVLSGAPRSATIRTATTTTLLSVTRAEVLALQASDPRLRDTLWAAYAERLFDDCARADARWAPLGRHARLALVRAGTPATVASGERIEAGGPVFVVEGRVEVERDGGRALTDGPALAEGRLVARGEARIVRLAVSTELAPRANAQT